MTAAVALAGCGDSDKSADASSKADAAADPKTVSSITPDDSLVEDLGGDASTALEAGCSVGSFDEQEAEHTAVGSIARKDWNSFPPTSGPHYENWAAFGTYDELLDDGFVLHNLEHGGVAVWYGDDVSDELVKLIDDQIDDGEKWLLMPRPGLDGIASSSWTKLMHCSNDVLTTLNNEAAAAQFIGAWFDAVESTGSDAEKDVPAYAGGMEDPKPVRDVSAEAPSFG